MLKKTLISENAIFFSMSLMTLNKNIRQNNQLWFESNVNLINFKIQLKKGSKRKKKTLQCSNRSILWSTTTTTRQKTIPIVIDIILL